MSTQTPTTSKKANGRPPPERSIDRVVAGTTATATFEHLSSRIPPSGTSCVTGVLRVASSSSSGDRKAPLHYWVEDRALVGSASRYFRGRGYDVAEFAPCSSRELWNRRNADRAPLQAEAIERDDGADGSARRPEGKGRAKRKREPVKSDCWPSDGESVACQTAPTAVADDHHVITRDAAASLRVAIQKRDMRAHPFQKHELLLLHSLVLDEANQIRDCVKKIIEGSLKSLVLDENNRVRSCVTKVLEGALKCKSLVLDEDPLKSLVLDEDDHITDFVTYILEGSLKDRDMTAAPFRKNERKLLGQMVVKGFKMGEAGEKMKLTSFGSAKAFEIARVPTNRSSVSENKESARRTRSNRLSTARRWMAHLPQAIQEDLVASIAKEEEEEGPCKKRRIPVGKLKWDDERKCFPDPGPDKACDQRYRCAWINANGKPCPRQIRSFCACNPNRTLCHDCIIKHRAYKMEDRERHGSSTKEETEGSCEKQWIPLGKLRWDADRKCFPDGTDGKDHQRFKWRYQCAWINLDGKACGKKVRTFCLCDPSRIICSDCIIKHQACKLEEKEREQYPAKELGDRSCEKQNIPAGKLKWDAESHCFPDLPVIDKNTRQKKYRCTGRRVNGMACGKYVRTFCSCSPSRTMCDDCIVKHWAHVVEDKERQCAD